MTTTMQPNDRYLVISSDGHAGADLLQYKEYLASALARRVRRVGRRRTRTRSPTCSRRPRTETGTRDRRLAEHDDDGVVAEVLYPNTVPPFFDQGNLVALPPTEADYDRRWAGLQAHNRWIVDFCAAGPRSAGRDHPDLPQPGRRRGRRDPRARTADEGERRDPAPGGLAQLRACTSCGTRTTSRCGRCARSSTCPLNVHSGSGLPDYGDLPAARAIMLVEIPWFAHRAAVAPHVRRRVRRPPGAAGRADRAGRRLDPAWPRDPRLVLQADDHRRCGRGRVLRRGRREHEDAPERVLRAARLGRGELPASERGAAGRPRSVSTGSCGATTTRTARAPTRYTTEGLRVAFAGHARRRRRPDGRAHRRRVLRLRRRRAPADRRPHRSDGRVPWHQPLAPADYPPDSTCNAFEREPALKAW